MKLGCDSIVKEIESSTRCTELGDAMRTVPIKIYGKSKEEYTHEDEFMNNLIEYQFNNYSNTYRAKDTVSKMYELQKYVPVKMNFDELLAYYERQNSYAHKLQTENIKKYIVPELESGIGVNITYEQLKLELYGSIRIEENLKKLNYELRSTYKEPYMSPSIRHTSWADFNRVIKQEIDSCFCIYNSKKILAINNNDTWKKFDEWLSELQFVGLENSLVELTKEAKYNYSFKTEDDLKPIVMQNFYEELLAKLSEIQGYRLGLESALKLMTNTTK